MRDRRGNGQARTQNQAENEVELRQEFHVAYRFEAPKGLALILSCRLGYPWLRPAAEPSVCEHFIALKWECLMALVLHGRFCPTRAGRIRAAYFPQKAPLLPWHGRAIP